MQVRISDPELALELADFLRAFPYVAVGQRDEATLEVFPVSSIGEQALRALTLELVNEWVANQRVDVDVRIED